MLTINTILKELKNVPVDRLAEVYSFIQSLGTNRRKASQTKEQILSYAGSFADMDEHDFDEFKQYTKDTRNNLFDRDLNI